MGIALRFEDSPWSEAILASSELVRGLGFLRTGLMSSVEAGGSAAGQGRVLDRVLRAGGEDSPLGVGVEVVVEEEEAVVVRWGVGVGGEGAGEGAVLGTTFTTSTSSSADSESETALERSECAVSWSSDSECS